MVPQVLVLSIFFAFSVGLFVWCLASINQDARKGKSAVDEYYDEGLIFKIMLPYIQTLGGVIERSPAFAKELPKLEKDLIAADRRSQMNPGEFMAMQFYAGIALGLALAGFDFALEMDFTLELGVGGLLAGALLPKLSLQQEIKARQKAIRRALPYSLDLLTLSVEAGLDFTTALGRIGEKLGDSPFGKEIKLLVRDLSMGKTRKEGLQDLADRTALEELNSVVAALIQADELGASLGPTLRIQSAEMRRRRFDLAEKAAQEAPVKMLFPLVAFIFPTVFIIIFAPIGLKFYFGN